MKKNPLPLVLVSVATLVVACGSMPRSTSLLEQTRSEYLAAQSNPNVASFAPLEMKQADAAMARAIAASNERDSSEKVDNLAYLAKQSIALAQEKAKQKLAESNIASAGKERDQIRINQRTNEADQANARAEQSKLAAQATQNEMAEAQRMTQAAQASAAQMEAQLTEMEAKKTDRGMVITLGDVLFGTDLARLNPDGMRTAQKLAAVLQQNPQRTVLVEGFADSTGTTTHNQQLSERRATAVRSALEELGVARERITIHGYGEMHPVAANDTDENRQLNRRVEIVLSDGGGTISPR